MLTVQGIVFIAGAVFVLIAILGGGFTIRELTVPEMSKNKRIGSGVIGALFIAYSLIMPPFSISTETSDTPGMRLIYAPDNDELDASEKDKLQASNLIVAAAHSPPQLNDLITVQFTLRNIGQRPITLEYVYVGANDPTHKYDADTSRGLGNFDLNETLEPNEEYHLKKSGTLPRVGEWSLFTCYKIAGEEDDDKAYCPESWNAFPVMVEESK